MSGRIAVLGEEGEGFALAGALAVPAGTPEEARAAWRALPADVALVVLTPAAAAALEGLLDDLPDGRLAVVMPG